jgi:hypothetical protein
MRQKSDGVQCTVLDLSVYKKFLIDSHLFRSFVYDVASCGNQTNDDEVILYNYKLCITCFVIVPDIFLSVSHTINTDNTSKRLPNLLRKKLPTQSQVFSVDLWAYIVR